MQLRTTARVQPQLHFLGIISCKTKRGADPRFPASTTHDRQDNSRTLCNRRGTANLKYLRDCLFTLDLDFAHWDDLGAVFGVLPEFLALLVSIAADDNLAGLGVFQQPVCQIDGVADGRELFPALTASITQGCHAAMNSDPIVYTALRFAGQSIELSIFVGHIQ